MTHTNSARLNKSALDELNISVEDYELACEKAKETRQRIHFIALTNKQAEMLKNDGYEILTMAEYREEGKRFRSTRRGA